MRFLLDTNICIYIIKRKPQKVFDRLQALDLSDVGISSITVAELEYGAYKSQRVEQNRAALNQFLLPLEIIPFDERITQVYGELRATLERQGTVIGAMGMLIAAQAIALSLTLITNNTKEFSQIQHLDLDNWVL